MYYPNPNVIPVQMYQPPYRPSPNRFKDHVHDENQIYQNYSYKCRQCREYLDAYGSRVPHSPNLEPLPVCKWPQSCFNTKFFHHQKSSHSCPNGLTCNLLDNPEHSYFFTHEAKQNRYNKNDKNEADNVTNDDDNSNNNNNSNYNNQNNNNNSHYSKPQNKNYNNNGKHRPYQQSYPQYPHQVPIIDGNSDKYYSPDGPLPTPFPHQPKNASYSPTNQRFSHDHYSNFRHDKEQLQFQQEQLQFLQYTNPQMNYVGRNQDPQFIYQRPYYEQSYYNNDENKQ